MSILPPIRELSRAVRRRDASYDGVFFIAVKTTGVFCRPSCPARRPRAHNIEYFSSGAEALRSGYRPCKRCRPLETDGRPPAWVQRLLQQLDAAAYRPLGDKDLRAMAIDPTRARRYFKEHYGMTFQMYQRNRRMGRAWRELQAGTTLTGVGLRHGYESESGFRDAFGRTFSRTPGRGREADCIVTTTIASPIGPLLVGATAKAVCLLEFDSGQSRERQLARLERRFQCPILPGDNEHLEQLKAELRDYFARRLRKFAVPLVYPGTPFQVAVWDRLRRIRYGQTVAYEQVATDVGHPGAQRAVGTANGANRIAIVIPCHRVVNKNGGLGGYGGELWRKKFLLELEQRSASGGRTPADAVDRPHP